MSTFTKFEDSLKNYYTFNIKYKNQSWMMKVLSIILFFNKGFMTEYITTIGNTIYFPNAECIAQNESAFMGVLAHEIVHVTQKEKYGMALYSLLYLFPQCLAIFAGLAILAIWYLQFLWCLLFLLFLAPLPAPWRKKFEVGGYTMTLYVSNLRMKRLKFPDAAILSELSVQALRISHMNFKGPGYWFMWPFGVDDELGKKVDDIRSGVISDTDEVYGRVERSYLNAVSG